MAVDRQKARIDRCFRSRINAFSKDGRVKLASMDSFVALTARYLRDERGATAIEYGLIIGFISLLVVTGGTLIGQSVLEMFQRVEAGIP